MGDIPEVRRGEGKSVASMWADMVHAAELGEVITVANKFGDDVAVMLSLEKFEELTGIDLRTNADLIDGE